VGDVKSFDGDLSDLSFVGVDAATCGQLVVSVRSTPLMSRVFRKWADAGSDGDAVRIGEDEDDATGGATLAAICSFLAVQKLGVGLDGGLRPLTRAPWKASSPGFSTSVVEVEDGVGECDDEDDFDNFARSA